MAFDSRLCLCRLPLQVVSFFGWTFFLFLFIVAFLGVYFFKLNVLFFFYIYIKIIINLYYLF